MVSPFRIVIGLLLGMASAFAEARQPETIRDWRAPAFWSPRSVDVASARPLSVQGDLTGALPFVAVTPCRQYDSRNTSALPENTPRTVSLSGAPCGIPSSVGAVSVNITVFSITGATGNGVFKVGVSSPPTSAWINYPPSETQRANAGVVSVGSGNIVVQVNQGGGSVQFTVDVNGYYVSTLNSGEQLLITASSGGGAIRGVNASGDGVQGETAGAGSSGVYGKNTGGGKGVFGASGGGNGVEGQSTSGVGVNGGSSSGAGVSGASNSGDGVFGTGATGVHGSSTFGWGVYGHSQAADGVHGDTPDNNNSGVAGINTAHGYGVFGVSQTGIGVFGGNVDSTNDPPDSIGVLGIGGSGGTSAEGGPGVKGVAGTGIATGAWPGVWGVAGTGGYGLYASGDIGASGDKTFVEPHPTDPTKEIRYACLEGPEVGTYFRGSGHITDGFATIAIPEDFKMVSDEAGITVQVTPVGSLATLACVKRSLDEIVIQGSADVDFDFTVNGVRKAFKDFQPVVANTIFVPSSASDPLFLRGLPAESIRRLKANGILKADGSINEETAHRLGWDQRPGWNQPLPAPIAALKPAPTSN